jgi:hypothetical protein
MSVSSLQIATVTNSYINFSKEISGVCQNGMLDPFGAYDVKQNMGMITKPNRQLLT